MFTKPHYILDVIAGILLAYAAYALFLRRYPRNEVPDLDRRLDRAFALSIIGTSSSRSPASRWCIG